MDVPKAHLEKVRELRAWIKAECSTVHAYVQPSAYDVIERSKSKSSEGVFDLELRSITAEEVKAVCQTMMGKEESILVSEHAH